jgi:hypothetical protein
VAIAHDALTRFPTTETTGLDTTTGDRSFTHDPVGTPKGVVVVVHSAATAAPVTGVTYAGVAMTLSSSATDTVETGSIWVYTLTQVAIPTDDPATVVLQGCTADSKFASCATVTAGTTGTKVNATASQNTTTSTNPSVNIVTTQTTMIYGAVHGGAAAPTSYAVGTNYTVMNSGDYGAKSARGERRTSEVTSGTIAFNFSFGTSDDWCIACVALEEEDLPGFVAGPPLVRLQSIPASLY